MVYKKTGILIILIALGFHSAHSQSFEIYKSDTINRLSVDEKKHGLWISFFDTEKKMIESIGQYDANRKTGVWKTYYPNGNLKSEITYVNNRPDGYAKLYYENGKVSEEGIWKVNKWVGQYLYYHPNGNKAYDWQFNENGKRTGEQKYYHANGQLQIKGDWLEGKENGVITEWDSNGNLKSEKMFAEGTINVQESKFTAEKKVSVSDIPDETNATSSKTKTEVNEQQETQLMFSGNGTFKLYNSFKKVSREGEFVNGRLINGKRYYYNPDGTLQKTEVYVNGRVSEVIK
jgi:antitoxin component YwqK of YwqJK toxin-antitoxin module